jgi:hypothetical protein
MTEDSPITTTGLLWKAAADALPYQGRVIFESWRRYVTDIVRVVKGAAILPRLSRLGWQIGRDLGVVTR